ncbi:NAD(P)-dependent glycerol-3-phosphate dehydrogenase [Gluconacetobacter azotocaptans]|uniref:NAD(P)H-dependent glycerol-3-phosphate dehydrogenase n=1 Tax=Gluconacetobacter azotocaptans TaxID=142834 RepID=UPI00195BF892|nr:NAD(P)H-dependent glycerol-3-phosphate dehydrogenase [Gluconacetobacter azotocaptans]MBM9402232.1 NAD(P)-dependent glycerol-3-phosphate dehydrogenase [Gluconacetobacter azotocaptans]
MIVSRIAVIGAGAWGIALATQAARAGAQVHLWARRPETLTAERTLPRLPTAVLPASVTVTSAMPVQADAVLLAVPMQHLRAVLAHVPPAGPMVACCKGVERDSLALPLDIIADAHPDLPRAVLSGPNFAHEVAQGLPTAAVLACDDGGLARRLADHLTTPTFRLYASDDTIGVQIGGAAKNVIAIAAGATIGAGLGENARASLMTRGLAELGRLAEGLGGRMATLSGLAGVGDLILTCTGPSSRNFSLGLALGRGETLDSILGQRTTVAEGVATAPAILALARAHDIAVPVIETMSLLLAGDIDLPAARDRLLNRPVGTE